MYAITRKILSWYFISCFFVLIFSTLPELMERKSRIDMHTNIATALLDQIKVGTLSLCMYMYIRSPYTVQTIMHACSTCTSFSYQARKLDLFFEMEDKMISKSSMVGSHACTHVHFLFCCRKWILYLEYSDS